MNEHFITRAKRVLQSVQPAAELSKEVEELLREWTALTDWQPETPTLNIQQGTVTAGGFAVLPAVAARCIDSPVRVLSYARALYQAVQDVRSANPHRPARVIYPGCGPYASLAALVLSVLSPEEVQVTLVDIHEASIDSARQLILQHGLEAHITAFEVADMLQYPLSDMAPPDIAILEILVAGLESEGQVAITRHLYSELPDIQLIPRQIRLDLRLVSPETEFSSPAVQRADEERIHLGEILCLDAEQVKRWSLIASEQLPCNCIALPEERFPGRVPLLFTELELYGEHRLQSYDDGITSPVCFDIDLEAEAGKTVQFNYCSGPRPGLKRVPTVVGTDLIRRAGA